MKADAADDRAMIALHATQLVTSRRGNRYRVRYAWHRGIRFNNPLECECYKRLEELQASGDVRYFVYQIPLRLPGGNKHLVNFQVVVAGCEPIWADAKEVDQPMGRRARAAVKNAYGIDIQLWSDPPTLLSHHGKDTTP